MTSALPSFDVRPRGGRPATGNCKWRKGRWMARITLESGERSGWLPLDPALKQDDVAGAKAAALFLSKDSRERGGVMDPSRVSRERRDRTEARVQRILSALSGLPYLNAIDVLVEVSAALQDRVR